MAEAPLRRAPAAVLPALALVGNAFVWGVSWWPFRQLAAAGLHPLWATVLIYAVAVAVLGTLARGVWRECATHPALWVVALASGLTNAAFNWAVAIGDVVRVVLLFYLMPVWALLFARLLLGERLGLLSSLRVALALAGAAAVLGVEALGAAPSAVDALAVLGGMSFALNNVMLRREGRRSETARAFAMFAGGVLVAGALALALAARAAVPWPPAPAAGWVGGALALAVAFLAANTGLQYGAARLRAGATAVIMLSEVVFATASALALGAGSLTAGQAAGGLAIVAAAALAALERPPPP